MYDMEWILRYLSLLQIIQVCYAVHSTSYSVGTGDRPVG